MKYLVGLYVFVLVTFISCTDEKEKGGNNFNYDLNTICYSGEIENPVNISVFDSANLLRIKILYTKKHKEIKSIRTFKLVNNSYYELILNTHFTDNVVDSIYTLAFTKKDTIYNYIFDDEKYVNAWPKGFDDWKYSIQKNVNQTYSLTRTHLRNSAFKEEFIYDEGFKFERINLFYGTDTMMFSK